MAKVLITNTLYLANRGCMAAAMGAMNCLKESMPDASITIFCNHYEEDAKILEEICKNQRVEIKKHPGYKAHNSKLITILHSGILASFSLCYCILGRASNTIRLPFKNAYDQYDIILNLSLDTFSDQYGVPAYFSALFNILLGIATGKPMVVWAASIGSFDKRSTRFLASLVLNRVDMIIAREQVTKEYLETLGVTKPSIYVTADHAFLMEPAPPKRISEILANEGVDKSENPLIGISASQLIHHYAFPGIQHGEERYQRYVAVMAETIDYLVDKLNADVLLISHVIVPNNDDRIISRKIYEQVKYKVRVKLITSEYMADELKGIIGACDLLIGSRMHSTIASTSMSVPTIAVVYGHKSHGVIGNMMGQDAYMIEIGKYDPDEFLDELRAKIDDAWAKRDSISNQLRERTQAAKQQAWLNGSLIKGLLENYSS